VSVAAFFDVDGTTTKTTILDPLIWYHRAHDSKFRFALFALGLFLRVPYYLAVDRRSRARCNVVFYRRYAGLSAADLRQWHQHTFADNLQRDGTCTGDIDGPAIADARKAELIRSLCEKHGINAALSFAYGNSLGDAPMLECVGQPVAVNADSRLRRLADRRGWPQVRWRT